MKSPKVSVIINVCNGENTIREAIESILQQSFRDFELIIVNDGSTDNTPAILNSYGEDKIKVINQENRGVPKSLNRAIRISQGEYVAHMDADDVSLPERLEKQVVFLDSHPKVGLVGSMAIELNELIDQERKISLPTTNQEIRRAMAYYVPIIHSSVMIRRSVFKDIGLYNEAYTYSEDTELWVRIASKYEVVNLQDTLIKKRIHKNQYFRNLDDEVRFKNEAYIGLKAAVIFSLPLPIFLQALCWYIYSRLPLRFRKLIKFDRLKIWLRKRRGGWKITSQNDS